MLVPVPIPPGPGQESVWDYPRPPRVEDSRDYLEIELAGRLIASADRSWRVLETSHPPTYYLPRTAFATGVLQAGLGATWCEWKGRATFLDLVVGSSVVRGAAWTYARPSDGYEAIADAVAVMPGLVERCTVNGEEVVPQEGGFYGGWITSRVVGPFKGGPGTSTW